MEVISERKQFELIAELKELRAPHAARV